MFYSYEDPIRDIIGIAYLEVNFSDMPITEYNLTMTCHAKKMN